MHIQVFNRGTRNQLVCERRDGSVEMADIGPELPHHDIAHFVVERQLKMKSGFFGNIYRGLSVAELSDEEVIRTLPQEAMASEIMTRALQAVGNGACRPEQFHEMVELEFKQVGLDTGNRISEVDILAMSADFKGLLDEWRTISEGEALHLTLEIEKW